MLESFTAKQMVAWLQDKHGASFIRQTGSHCYWVTKDGITIGCPDHKSATPHPIDTVLAGRIATKLGMTLHDLRSEFGLTAGKRHATKKRATNARPRSTAPYIPPPPPPSADVLGRQLAALGERIMRSGPARKRDDAALRALERHVIRVSEWLDIAENGVAA